MIGSKLLLVKTVEPEVLTVSRSGDPSLEEVDRGYPSVMKRANTGEDISWQNQWLSIRSRAEGRATKR